MMIEKLVLERERDADTRMEEIMKLLTPMVTVTEASSIKDED